MAKISLASSYKLFTKYRRIVLLAFLILFAELIFFTYISYPPSPLYSIKKPFLNAYISSQSTHKAKAKAYLAESGRLQGHLDMLLKDKGSYEELKSVAGELMHVQQSAIVEMDLAAKKGADIESEIEKLCDQLIKQQVQLKQAIVKTQKIATLPFEQYANLTQILLDESAGW